MRRIRIQTQIMIEIRNKALFKAYEIFQIRREREKKIDKESQRQKKEIQRVKPLRERKRYRERKNRQIESKTKEGNKIKSLCM